MRWLDRCIDYHEQSGKKDKHNLFAIVQGGLDHGLRDICLDEMIKRKDRVAGYAIGGLSGGEEKGKVLKFTIRHRSDVVPCADTFWRMLVALPSRFAAISKLLQNEAMRRQTTRRPSVLRSAVIRTI